MANNTNENKSNKTNEILSDYIDKFNTSLLQQIGRVVDNIKYQNNFDNLSYKVDKFIIISNNLNNINIVIDSKLDTKQVEDNMIYININPLILIGADGSCNINMINKNISSLFFKDFEKLLLNILQIVNNVQNITIQNNYICNKFYRQIQKLPISCRIVIR